MVYTVVMQIYENVSLADHCTMRIGGDASYLTIIDDVDDLHEVVDWAKKFNQEILTIGEGSNIIFRDSGWDGLVVIMKIPGFEVLAKSKTTHRIKIGGGEVWDSVVKQSVDMRLSGIEALSLIPGTAGAAPVQNIGAYGQEIAQTIHEVEVLDKEKNKIEKLSAKDCKFGYRDSIFKTAKGKSKIITSITLDLSIKWMSPPFYESLQKYFEQTGIKEYSPANVRDAVIAIRNQKLPDPRAIANTGSFFKNPIVSKKLYESLKETYQDIKGFEQPGNKYKLSAGWMIEKAGFKNFRHENGFGTFERHALVMVNYGSSSYRDLATVKKIITDKVEQMFGVVLEQEPETI
jgi:UDP-N-acetylmuramate dehydrogenase